MLKAMSVTITEANIDQHRSGSWPRITELVWKTWPLDASVLLNFPNIESLDCSETMIRSLDGLKGCPQLLQLECTSCRLSSLEGIENVPQLRVLQCDRNLIRSLAGIESCTELVALSCIGRLRKKPIKLESLAGLEYCPKLESLNCAHNYITTLAELASCTKLTKLNCNNNRITSLEGIDNCLLLTHLWCAYNNISTLIPIQNCTLIETLDCGKNQLQTLTGIERCSRLTLLYCHQNKLTTLDGIQFCSQVTDMQCYMNRIRTLEHIVYLRHLHTFICSSNLLDIQTIQVLRVLERLDLIARRRIELIFHRKVDHSIYADSQNVHDVHIQKTVCDSVRSLLTDPKPTFSIDAVIRSGMCERSIRIILEYCDDESVHSHHLLTYSELLAYIWARVCRSEHKDELIKILGEQVCDSECKCFTGRFNRTLSVLAGFYPDIVISISDNSRIGAIIMAAGAKVRPYDAVQHQALAHQLLLEAGYTELEIQPWLEAIDEP